MRRVKRRGPSGFVAGLIAIVVICVACFFGFTKKNPFEKSFEMSAAFKTASDIKPKSPVRVAGVTVGTVTKVEPIEKGRRDGAGAIVYMKITDGGLPLKRDARMKIRPRIFLEGNWFVDVSPGSPSAPELKEGATLPVQQTATPVQFGEILTALQSDTREDLKVVLDEYGRALVEGGARGYNRSLRYQKPAFRDSAQVNEATLGRFEHDLTNYLRGADRFARGLNRSPAQLKALITDFGTFADAFADEERALTATIAELPRTLSTGRRALGRLNGAFPPFRRLIADLRPTVRSSGPALDATSPLIRELRGLVSPPELRGLVADLRETVPDLAELNEGGVALQKELRQLSSCTNEVLTPWRNDKIEDEAFPASGPVFQEQVKWMPGIAAESRSHDANGQYVRSAANGANYAYNIDRARFFLTGVPLAGVNPPVQRKIPPLRADVPCETQEPPDLRTKPGEPPPMVPISQKTPGLAAKRLKAKDRAVEWLRDDIKRLDLDIKVKDDLLDAGALPRLTGGKP